MATIYELLKLDGVAAAGDFRSDRGLVGDKANMDR